MDLTLRSRLGAGTYALVAGAMGGPSSTPIIIAERQMGRRKYHAAPRGIVSHDVLCCWPAIGTERGERGTQRTGCSFRNAA
jgi:hypothetical protein